jgi:hypothetical protein
MPRDPVPGDSRLVRAPHGLLEEQAFPSDAAHFLVEAGLPRSCAPFLTFEDVALGPLTLVQRYGAHQFRPSELPRLASFYVLGSDGAGNPLCLDTARNGVIVMLDHEDRFRTQTFVASSVANLAEALLILHTVPHDQFIEKLRPSDPPAAERSAFLPVEVSMLGD